jgi:hypothetical protein
MCDDFSQFFVKNCMRLDADVVDGVNSFVASYFEDDVDKDRVLTLTGSLVAVNAFCEVKKFFFFFLAGSLSGYGTLKLTELLCWRSVKSSGFVLLEET